VQSHLEVAEEAGEEVMEVEGVVMEEVEEAGAEAGPGVEAS
jgi:hypothetical protein